MRRTAHLYRLFRKEDVQSTNGNSPDMFKRENLESLAKVIEIYTKNVDDSLKAGLKQNLYYLIKKSAVVVQYTLL